jgi:hypothetical protein
MAWVYSEELKAKTGNGWSEEPEPVTSKMAVIPTSQNGYIANNRSLIATMTAGGVEFPVRKGPCGELLMWAAGRWHNEVEPLVPGTCWGYAERDIIGSNVISNHASGTAVDLNAPKHPLGTNPSTNFTASQITAVRRIITDSRGALRWGGDYTGRKDGMHVEINAPEAEVAAVLAEVNGAGGMSPNTAQQVDEIHEQVTGVLQAWAGGITDDKNTPYNMLQHLLRVSVSTNQTALMVEQLVNQPRQQVQLHPDTVQRFTAAVVAGVHEKTEATVADITHRAVVDEMATSGFWASALERAAKTFAQTALILLGAGPLDVLHIAWQSTLSLSAGAALLSVLTSLASAQTGTSGTPSLVKERN